MRNKKPVGFNPLGVGRGRGLEVRGGLVWEGCGWVGWGGNGVGGGGAENLGICLI